LLVDDHSDARNTFARLLASLKLNVTTARDGQQACELALEAQQEGRPFDWILMDMQMPVVDGYEATRRLRSLGYDRPIIAMTAYASDEDRRECLRYGCTDHIAKPIDWTRLAAILEKWLGAGAS
jgi:CheY-like chemotaxis protein